MPTEYRAAPRRIDVHHHPSLPSHTAAMEAGGVVPLAVRLRWTVSRSLEDMDRGGVATAILSLPQFRRMWPADAAAGRRLARECNEQMAALARDHPGRFGLFAALPAHDVDGS